MAFKWLSNAGKGAWNALTGQTDYKTHQVAGVYDGSYKGFEGMAKDMATQSGQDFRGTRQGVLDQAAGLNQLQADYAAAPSYAEQAARANLAQSNANAMSAAASARGANSALMLREQANANAQQGRQAALDVGAMSAQEMAGRYQARAGMMGQSGQMQQGVAQLDFGREQQGADRDAAMRQDVTSSEMQRQGIQSGIAMGNAAGRQKGVMSLLSAAGGAMGGGGGGGGGAVSDIRAKTDVQPMSGPDWQTKLGAALRAYGEGGGGGSGAATTAAAGAMGGGGGWASALAALSDEREKEKLKMSDELDQALARDYGSEWARELDVPKRSLVSMAADPQANRAALDNVHPYAYRYKPEAAAAFGEDTRPRVGVMAQELERSGPAGKGVVFETPGGMKALDLHRALGFSLAASAGLDKRIARLEAAVHGR